MFKTNIIVVIWQQLQERLQYLFSAALYLNNPLFQTLAYLSERLATKEKNILALGCLPCRCQAFRPNQRFGVAGNQCLVSYSLLTNLTQALRQATWRLAERHSAEWHLALCSGNSVLLYWLSIGKLCAECRFASSHFALFYYAECHLTECHFANSHFAKRHSAVSICCVFTSVNVLSFFSVNLIWVILLVSFCSALLWWVSFCCISFCWVSSYCFSNFDSAYYNFAICQFCWMLFCL